MKKAIANWLSACREWHDNRAFGREYLEERARMEGVDLASEIAISKSILRHAKKVVKEW